MCFNIESSKFSFIVNIICFLILFFIIKTKNNENKIAALLFFYIGLMQLYDWIFWLNQDKNNTNFFFTKLAMITNYFQPIILALIIYIYKKKLKTYSIYILIVYCILSLSYIIYNFNKINYTLVTDVSKPSLYWEWNYKKYYEIIYIAHIITLLLLIILNVSFYLNILMSGLIFLSLLFTKYNYKNSQVGRFWCYYASFSPLLILFYYIINEMIFNQINL